MKSRLGIFHRHVLPNGPRVCPIPPLLHISASLVSSQSFSPLTSCIPVMSDPPPPDQPTSNSLGLDLEALKIKDGPDAAPSAPEDVPSAAADTSQETNGAKDEEETNDATAGKKEPKEKKKPYVNPDRVKTGGAQRVCSEQRVLVDSLNAAGGRRNPARKSWQNAWHVSGNRTKRSSRGGWYGSLHPPSVPGSLRPCRMYKQTRMSTKRSRKRTVPS